MKLRHLAIIIPGYNCANYIRKCLDSIFAQNYTDFDVFFVDDGSNDQTASIVKEYGERVIYIYQENAGVSKARNRALDIAELYQYIMFIDSDDWLEADCLERVFEDPVLLDYNLLDWYEYKCFKGNIVREYHQVIGSQESEISIDAVKMHFLRSRAGGSPWGKIFNNSIIKEHKIRFAEELPYAEDYLFNLEYLSHATTIKLIPHPLYAYNCIQEGARLKFRRNFVDLTIQIEDHKSKIADYDEKQTSACIQAGLIEQMQVATVNLKNKEFTTVERIKELKKIKHYLQKRQLGIKSIIRSDARWKAKLICIGLLIFGPGDRKKQTISRCEN